MALQKLPELSGFTIRQETENLKIGDSVLTIVSGCIAVGKIVAIGEEIDPDHSCDDPSVVIFLNDEQAESSVVRTSSSCVLLPETIKETFDRR